MSFLLFAFVCERSLLVLKFEREREREREREEREREKGAPACAKREEREVSEICFFFSQARALGLGHARQKEKNKIILQGSIHASRHNSAHALVSNKMTSMSSMGSHSNKDRSKTASSATVTRLFQKSLRDLITGTFLLLEFGVGKIQRESPRLLLLNCALHQTAIPFSFLF